MKIVITVNTYYPLKDGVQSVTGYHAENLVKKGHQVTVITPKNGNVEEEVHNGVKILRVNIRTKHAMYYGDKKEYQELVIRECKDADAMVNVCTQNPMTDLLFPIFHEIKCKKVLYMHGMHDLKWRGNVSTSIVDIGHKIWNNWRWGIYYRTSGQYFKQYDKIIQLHRFDLAYIFFEKRYGIKSVVIENAAENQFFELKNKVKEKKYAICVANYMSRKNQEFVLKAFYKAENLGNFGLVFIGSDNNSYYDRLISLNKKLISMYGERDVQILYGISRNETIEYIKNASIYMLGSKWEAFPISIVESMAAEIPFISTDVGCVKYLPGGVIVENEDEMAYWLSLLAKNEDTRNLLGNVGREYASKHLSIESKVSQLEYILEN